MKLHEGLIPGILWLLCCTAAHANLPVTPLTGGTAVFSSVGANNYVYFSYTVSNIQATLFFDVTPYTGDPDFYVACTIDPTGTAAGSPSSVNFVRESIDWGEDSVKMTMNDPDSCFKGGPGEVYLSVFGFLNSTFSIVVYTLDESIALSDGLPQNGFAVQGAFTYFRYWVTSGASSIAVSIRAIHGNADMFVNVNTGRKPTMTDFQFRSAGDDSMDTVTIPSSARCSGCYMDIGVIGYLDTAFVITVVADATISTLQDGQATAQATVDTNQYAYFKFTLDDSPSTLTFVVTTFSGDANLVVCYGKASPVMQDAETDASRCWTAQRVGLLEDVVYRDSAQAGIYYVGIFGVSRAQYTLLAHVNNHVTGLENLIHVYPGSPQAGYVQLSGYSYYQLTVYRLTEDLKFAVTPSLGDVALYIKTCPERSDKCTGREGGTDYRPTKTSFTWSADNSPGRERIVIPATTQEACQQCSYIIGVYGTKESIFSLVAGSETTLVRLVDGRPVKDYVDFHMYHFYSFEVVTDHLDVSFTLTPFSGDPDLFISRSTSRPNATDYTWAHRGFGEDSITVAYGDRDSGAGIYYIGVYGYSSSSYSIIAATDNDLPANILPGVPQNGFVNATKNDIYECYLPPVPPDASAGAPALLVRLLSLSGDADLYASVAVRPTHNIHQYQSLHNTGEDSIEVRHTDAEVAANCPEHLTGGCAVLIDVYGFRPAAYSITCITAADTVTLQDGVPVQATVNMNTYSYYVFPIEVPTQLDFTVTALSGDPDLYVSTTDQHPTSETYQWKSDGTDSEQVSITLADPLACTPPCNYFVGVFGYLSSSYTLLATMVRDLGVTQLISGIPQAGYVPVRGGAQCFAYYVFSVAAGVEDVTFQATALSGGIEMYVSNVVDPSDHSTSIPILPLWDRLDQKVIDYQFASSDDPSAVRVEVTSADPKFCSGCYYAVAIIAAEGSSSAVFNVVGSASGAILYLVDGVAHSDQATTGVYTYYVISVVDISSPLTVSITPFSGRPTAYIGVEPNTRPTAQNFQNLASDSNGYSVTMAHECTSAPCSVYIGVTSDTTDASYSIVASLKNSADYPFQLQNGSPQVGGVDINLYKYYSISVQNDGQISVSIAVLTVFGDVDVFISKRNSTAPTKDSFDFDSIDVSAESVLTLTPADLASCGMDCVLRIAVMGVQTSSFNILVSTSDNLVILQDGVPVVQNTDVEHFAFFRIANLDPANVIQIDLTALTGDPDLYIIASKIGESIVKPSLDSYYWKSDNTGSESLVIDPTVVPLDPHYCVQCRYVIGVYGFSNATYSLLVTLQPQPRRLLFDGQPQTGSVGAAAFVYYRIKLGTAASDLNIRVTDTSGGNPDLFVTNVPDALPTTSSYVWSSASQYSAESVFIKGPHDPAKPYTIGVYGTTSSSFSIVAATTEVVQRLQEGVQVRGFSDKGATSHYVFMLAEPSRDLDISVTALTGDPVVVASTIFEHPSCSSTSFWLQCANYTWAGGWGSRSSLNISHAAPCASSRDPDCSPNMYRKGPVYIGVFGQSATTFSISVNMQGDHINLQPGLPQDAVTSEQVMCPARNAEGQCVGTQDSWENLQASFFTFTVSNAQFKIGTQVSISLARDCNTGQCEVPLSLFVSSCHLSQCVPESEYPSSFAYLLSQAPSLNSRTTVFLAYDATRLNNGYCDATTEACVYYIGVFASSRFPERFSILMSKSDDLEVIPKSQTADEIITLTPKMVQGANRYEVYVDDGKDAVVTLESCTGTPALYICDDSCASLSPTEDNYKWFSDATTHCERQVGHAQPKCSINPYHSGYVEIPAAQRHNYFVSVLGTGSYVLAINTGNATRALAPLGSSEIRLGAQHANTIQLQWSEAVFVDSMNKHQAIRGVSYSVYYMKTEILNSKTGADVYTVGTPCGLDKYAVDMAARPVIVVDATSASLSGLEPGTSYEINVVATCDSACNGGGAPRTVAYTSFTIETPPRMGGMGALPFALGGVLLVLCCCVSLFAARMYVKSRKLEKKLAYEMQDVRNMGAIASGSEVLPATKGKANARSALLAEKEELDAAGYGAI